MAKEWLKKWAEDIWLRGSASRAGEISQLLLIAPLIWNRVDFPGFPLDFHVKELINPSSISKKSASTSSCVNILMDVA